MNPTVTYDPEANAAYIRLSSEKIERSEEVSSGIVLDYDADGKIVGMEIPDAREHLSADLLAQGGLTFSRLRANHADANAGQGRKRTASFQAKSSGYQPFTWSLSACQRPAAVI